MRFLLLGLGREPFPQYPRKLLEISVCEGFSELVVFGFGVLGSSHPCTLEQKQ